MRTSIPFWSRVEITSTCWNWTGPTRSKTSPYGSIRLNGKNKLAHRHAYEMLIGPIDSNLTVDHLCKNTKCVNPAHMELVSLSENARRSGAILKASAKAAENQLARNFCINGHEFTKENTYLTSRQRHCKQCRQDAQRKAYWRKKNG